MRKRRGALSARLAKSNEAPSYVAWNALPTPLGARREYLDRGRPRHGGHFGFTTELGRFRAMIGVQWVRAPLRRLTTACSGRRCAPPLMLSV